MKYSVLLVIIAFFLNINFVGMERSALHRKLKGLGIKEFN